MALRYVLIGLSALLFAAESHAQLVFANGSFESGAPAEGASRADVGAPWYDYNFDTGSDANFWENAWDINWDGASFNDTSMLALSAFAADGTLDGAGLNGYAYQSLGSDGSVSSLTISFDWGSFEDTAVIRDLGLTIGIYESDGTFVPDNQVDVLGASGITLLDQQSLTALGVNPGEHTVGQEVTFDLSSQTGGELFLRFNNFEPTSTQVDEAWVGVDNVQCAICALPPGFIDVTLEVDRDTGTAQLVNHNAASIDLIGYSVTSPVGAIDNANWTSIAATGDSDSGGTIDPDDMWQEVVSTANEISEIDPVGEGSDDGALFTSAANINLGSGLWVKSPFEELGASITLFDGLNEITQNISVNFSGTTQTTPYMRSDFDFDGDIDADDFHTFFDHHLTELGAATLAESYPLGDLNGDLANNVVDFGLFKADFIAANGVAAFAALLAGTPVPEPSSVVLVLLALTAGGLTRVRAGRPARHAIKALLAVAVAGLWLSSSAQAVVVSFSPTAPTPDANDVSYFVTDALTDVQNVYDAAIGVPAADGAANDYATYAALDRQHQGQTFTTGSTGGYVNAVWLQNPGYTGNTDLTYYSLAAGSQFQVRITAPTQAGTAGFALADENSQTLLGTEANNFAPVFGSSADGTGSWVRFAFENPISVSANTQYGFDVTGLVGFFETLGSSAGSYAGGDAYNGTTAGMADDVLNPLVGDRSFLVEIDATPGHPVPETIVLNIDQDTGLVGLTNTTSSPFSFDHYELHSEVGGLSSAGWNSFSAEGRDAVDGPDAGEVAGDSVGETWTIPGGVDAGQTSTNLLAEAFVLGSTTIAPNQTILLGNAYNATIDDSNVSGTLRSTTGALVPLFVSYDGIPEGLAGDFNGDGSVNLADYTVWRDNLGADESTLAYGTGDGSGTVDIGDYNSWKSNFGAPGATIGGVAAAAVPEPSALALLLLTAGAFAGIFRKP